MEIQASRLQARVGPHGEPVLLMDQDRRRWDRLHIRRGLAALARAEELSDRRALRPAGRHRGLPRPGLPGRGNRLGPAGPPLRRAGRHAPSPIVELNRAVAVSMASGPAPALASWSSSSATGTLDRYHLLYSVHGDLLQKLGRRSEAADQFERGAALARNGPERRLSEDRARASRSAADAPVPAGLPRPLSRLVPASWPRLVRHRRRADGGGVTTSDFEALIESADAARSSSKAVLPLLESGGGPRSFARGVVATGAEALPRQGAPRWH